MRRQARLVVVVWFVLVALTVAFTVALCALPAGGARSCRTEVNRAVGSVNTVIDYLNAHPRVVSPAQIPKAVRCPR